MDGIEEELPELMGAKDAAAELGVKVPNLRLTIAELAGGTQLVEFPMSATDETAFVSCELYRRAGQCKFRAVAQGVIGIAFIQAILVGVCLLVAGVPLAGVLAVVVLVLGIAQVPALIVTLPAIAYLWASGNYGTFQGAMKPGMDVSQLDWQAAFADQIAHAKQLGGLVIPRSFVLLGRVLAAVAGLLATYKPKLELPVAWKVEEPFREGAPSDATPKGRWWERFNDAQLNQLAERALADSPTLARAQARLRQAQEDMTARSGARCNAASKHGPRPDAYCWSSSSSASSSVQAAVRESGHDSTAGTGKDAAKEKSDGTH